MKKRTYTSTEIAEAFRIPLRTVQSHLTKKWYGTDGTATADECAEMARVGYTRFVRLSAARRAVENDAKRKKKP